MLDIKVRSHDAFTLEMKVGFIKGENQHKSDFTINTWIFIPNTLDLNTTTYSKDQFYSDVKSKVRFITPVYKLTTIVDEGAIPYNNLSAATHDLLLAETELNVYEIEFQLKMFMAIFRSALRNAVTEFKQAKEDQHVDLIHTYVNSSIAIRDKYRALKEELHQNEQVTGKEYLNYFSFADEYLSYTLLRYSFLLLDRLMLVSDERFQLLQQQVKQLILSEQAYMKSKGYSFIKANEKATNQEVIYRYAMLNKYVESDLLLESNKKKDSDGIFVQQVYYSIAAGVSMVFATIVAFSFQQKYGNFTMPLFVALVVGYMLKDRIKELMRFYFAGKLGGKYFDNKTSISVKGKQIGWIKEAVDFITDEKVPSEILNIRNRSVLLEVENRIHNEKILLYRKKVSLDRGEMMKNSTYFFKGVHDIFRFNLTRLMQRMDNPKVAVLSLDEQNEQVIGFYADKVYYINFISQIEYEDHTEYKRYRIICQRDGIQKIEELFT
ncbi:hypothetical protein HX004_08965 [Myroides sp. 1354]|uniref:hypothetical protein n=1 Tax=unclassified Myroides TaxID=2642485 RepID=UPI00257907C6|nr:MULTISPECIES: hypothetical protein [unclassified Myroides]MDM1045021.1 hypothetical protein [Myroides sp. R163-1]MDM1055903.1 hypothetical protein [Myroides sp. 1354]MDM1069148.1 hypothetical protein [Myroides sp. 1372]